MDRPVRDVLTSALAVLLVAGCASTEAVRPPEGQVAMRAGAAGPGADPAALIAGPEVHRPAVVVPAFDPIWQAVWSDPELKSSGGRGAFQGLLTGLMFLQAVPVSALAWPIVAGMLVGTTAMGAVGEHLDTGPFARMDAQDRAALLEAAAALRPDRLLRESALEALAARTGQPPLVLPWYPDLGPDATGSNPLADARGQGIDGVLDLTVEAFGLAKGEEPDTFGVFVRVRARLIEPATGGLRYDRVLEYGPGRPLAGVPRPNTHTVEFLGIDQGRVFQHEMREVIARLGRVIVGDPALPVAQR